MPRSVLILVQNFFFAVHFIFDAVSDLSITYLLKRKGCSLTHMTDRLSHVVGGFAMHCSTNFVVTQSQLNRRPLVTIDDTSVSIDGVPTLGKL